MAVTAVTEPFSIDPDAFYTVAMMERLLDVSVVTLSRARKTGALRCVKKGRSVLFRGQWVLNWLENETATRQ